MFRQLGPAEIILILAVVVLLFGAKKLPELARGSGRALRIFKAETKGLVDDDEDETSEPRSLQAREADVRPAGSAEATAAAEAAQAAEAQRQAEKTD